MLKSQQIYCYKDFVLLANGANVGIGGNSGVSSLPAA